MILRRAHTTVAEKDTHSESTHQNPQQQGNQQGNPEQGTQQGNPDQGKHQAQAEAAPQPGATKATVQSPGTYPPGEDPRRWKVLGVILTTIFMSLISVSIINVALPSIQQGLGATESDIQWVLAGYTLTFGVVLVAAGRAGDLLGRGGIYLIGLGIYTISAIAAGFAPTAEALNVTRFIQGIGAGLLNPQGVGMIQQYFRGKERGRAFGWFGTVVGVAVAIGPTLGGFLIRLGGPEHGWRWTFLVNVPFGLLAFALALLWFPRPLLGRVKDPVTGRNVGVVRAVRSLDPMGSVLLGLTVLAFLYPFVEHSGSARNYLLLPVAALLLLAWLAWERHVKTTKPFEPMVDMQIFRFPSFRLGTMLAGVYFMGITSIWVLVALFFQNGLGHSALVAGSVGIPAAISSAVSANWAGKRVGDKGRIVVIQGITVALTGIALTILALVLHHTAGLSEWWMVLTLFLVGTGQGAVIGPNQTLTLADVPLNYAGSSGAVLQTAQRIGTAVGLAFITAIVFASASAINWTIGTAIGFVAIGVLMGIGLLIALYDNRTRARQAQ